jgi:hypothetical protein
VKKFHVFQGQNKEVAKFKAEISKVKDELEFQSTKLQEEIDDWSKRYENLEQEKENLFNTMASTLREKDRVIGHLQTSNNELKQYIENLEKQFDYPKQYQGKTVSESKNKSRTIKNFLSRAEVALWFSEAFGIEIEALHVNESDTGAKHLLYFSGNNGESESVPEQNNSRYSSLDENEKKQIEEILFLLDKFCVGDSFYHELSMLHQGLPRSYLIKQCRDDLNAMCHIDRLPGSSQGAKVHSIREVIVEHVKEYLAKLENFDSSKDKIQIKVSGDGAKMTRNSNFVLISFSMLQLRESVMSSKENRTIAVLNGHEDYNTLKESLRDVFIEINAMIHEGQLSVGDSTVKTEFFLGGDYKFLLLLLGLKGATSNYACMWCKVHKSERWKVDRDYRDYNSTPLCRSLKEIKEMCQKKTDNYCCCSEPLLDIDLDHVIVDELHLMLRVTDVMTENLIREMLDWDKEDEFDRIREEKQGIHIQKLINVIRYVSIYQKSTLGAQPHTLHPPQKVPYTDFLVGAIGHVHPSHPPQTINTPI